MLRALLTCVSFAVLLSAAGCGEVVTSQTDAGAVDASATIDGAVAGPCDGPSIAQENLVMCLGDFQCDWLLACTTAFPDKASCVEEFTNGQGAVEFQRTLDAIAAGRQTYDGAKAFQCLSSLDPDACNDPFTDQQACDETFVGTVNPGALCYGEQDCAVADSNCDFGAGGCALQCCPGQCVSPAGIGMTCGPLNCEDGAYCIASLCQSGAGGSPCANNFECDDDFYCGGTQCIADVSLGAACSDDSQCTLPNFCFGDDLPAGAGTCQPAAASGHNCDADCDGDFYCDGAPLTAGSCRSQPAIGEPCTDSDARCKAAIAYCDVGSGLCVARGQVTDACSLQQPCTLDLNCAGGVCTQKPGLGQPCDNSGCAAGVFCTIEITGGPAGTCATPQASGSVCSRDTHCSSFVCTEIAVGSEVCQDYMVCP